nr:uncharacterized protein LOC126054629 [Helicoverpa armigera]
MVEEQQLKTCDVVLKREHLLLHVLYLYTEPPRLQTSTNCPRAPRPEHPKFQPEPTEDVELKKKWANIRDYRKEVQSNKNIPSGSAAKKAKTYIYSDLLYFLTPIFCKRDSESNYPKEIDATQNENEDENTHPEIHSMESSPPPPSETNKPVLNQKRKKDIPSQILDILQQRQKATSKISSTDEDDDTFLLSFRSHMKNMNPQQKNNFQLGMLQLVKKSLLEMKHLRTMTIRQGQSPVHILGNHIIPPRKAIIIQLPHQLIFRVCNEIYVYRKVHQYI